MEWLLIGLIILAILVNIKSSLVLSQCKQQRTEMIEDTDAIHQSMAEFVSNVEKENDELYYKLVDYIKEKESKFDETFRILEGKSASGVMSTATIEDTLVNEDDEKKASSNNSNGNEQENEKISQLYKQGFAPKQIAKVLQVDHGEVELIINMYKKKKSYHK